MTQQRLTVAEANEIGGAIHQLSELEAQKIVEKDCAAQKRALTTFIQTKLLLRAEEFLAAWFTMKQEYEPYLMAQASMFGNVMTIIQRRQQIMAEQAQAQSKQPAGDSVTPEAAPEPAHAAEPANVIQLNPK
jgi:hypothetical protein